MNENTNMAQGTLATTATSAVESPRTLDMVAAEIRTFTASMLNNIIEIGRRMCEAKEMLPYGKFGDWIKENTGYSRSTANNFMRVFQEYGTRQGSLFGATVENDQAFGKLTYTQALALLALPAGEREEFVETHDVEDMSTRELQAAIEERNAAIKRAEEAEKSQEHWKEQMKAAREERDDAISRLHEAEDQLSSVGEVQQDQEAIDKAVAEAVEKANAAHTAELEKLRTSEEKKRKKLEKQVAEAENTAKAAEEKATQAGSDAAGEAAALRAEAVKQKAEAERLRRELAMSGEATVAFKLYFAAWQQDYQNMMGALAKVDEETAGRLKAAITAQIEGWSMMEDKTQ